MKYGHVPGAGLGSVMSLIGESTGTTICACTGGELRRPKTVQPILSRSGLNR